MGKLARKVSRELRINSTDEEKKLWNVIKNRQFLNLRFLRQYPIFHQYNNKKNFFIADFYCHEIKMVSELDSYIHGKQRDYDQIRTEILEFKNILIVRFENAEIMENLDHSLNQLKVVITKRKNDLENDKI
ncbi:MAG: hypothetical protein A2Y94_13555 [Caldithrix sp. RBG_13_44_9]|nr:MAG: hypothetical protein A2Y94_13555 [Caldithrix sp. RBG_13_44_9]